MLNSLSTSALPRRSRLQVKKKSDRSCHVDENKRNPVATQHPEGEHAALGVALVRFHAELHEDVDGQDTNSAEDPSKSVATDTKSHQEHSLEEYSEIQLPVPRDAHGQRTWSTLDVRF